MSVVHAKEGSVGEGNHYFFPSPFVWWTKIPDHEQIKQKYMPLILNDIDTNGSYYNQKNTWDCKVTSSFFNEDVYSVHIFDTAFHNKVIWDPLDQMITELNGSHSLPAPKSSSLLHVWYNKYEHLNWQEVHNHCPLDDHQTFSGIYILDLDSKNPTSFVRQQELRCFSTYSMQHLDTKNLSEGHVIIFPGELMHYVNPNLGENRLTVSFNIVSNYGTK